MRLLIRQLGVLTPTRAQQAFEPAGRPGCMRMSNNENPGISQPDGWVLAKEILLKSTENNIPIYILSDNKIQVKKKPQNMKAMFYVNGIESNEVSDDERHEFEEIINAIKTIVKEPNSFMITKRMITYEVYKYDGEKQVYISDVKGMRIDFETHTSFYYRHYPSKNWAISYGLVERFQAKFEGLVKSKNLHVDVPSDAGDRPGLLIVLPQPKELLTIINKIMGEEIKVTSIDEIDKIINEKIEQMKKLAEEIRMLRERKRKMSSVNIPRIENVVESVMKVKEQEVRP